MQEKEVLFKHDMLSRYLEGCNRACNPEGSNHRDGNCALNCITTSLVLCQFRIAVEPAAAGDCMCRSYTFLQRDGCFLSYLAENCLAPGC